MIKKEWNLKAESELRCVLAENEAIIVQLVEGNAEIFGIEMAMNREYTFRDENIAVFTWYGCKLEASGSCQSAYISSETPMVAYVNTHAQLEAKRDVALANLEYGPRVLIVGRTDSGKSTLAHILASYAVRLDRTPLFVDIDVGQGSVTIPGCLSAVPLDKLCLNIEEGFSLATPLVYFYGHTSPRDNVELYKHLVDSMAAKIKQRCDKDIDARSSGLVVNTCGWVDGVGFDLLVHCVEAFEIDVILVMGDDRLYFALTSSVNESIAIVKLPRSGGAVERDSVTRRRCRKSRVQEYFYGRRVPSGVPQQLSPCRMDIRLSTVKILKAGGVQLSEAMLPIGQAPANEPLRLVPVTPSQDLLHSILAVVHPVTEDHPDSGNAGAVAVVSTSSTSQPHSADKVQQLIHSNAAGFIYIVEINFDTDTIVVLSPCPGALPSKFLILGSIKWME